VSVDFDTIAFGCGSGLFFYDYSKGTKSSIWPDDSFSIGALASHRKRKLVACSEKSRRPRVFLISYPSTEIVGVLEDVAVHEVQDIAFSRCGNYLAVLGSLPDFNVSLFDISEKPRLLARGPLSGAPCHFITFNPHDPSVLCCSGSGHVVFWKYVKSISGNVSFSYKAGRVPVGEKTRYGFHSHCWNTKKEVICGTTHAELFLFDSLTCEGEEIINNVGQGTITSLLFSKDFIIVGSESGSVSCIGSTSSQRICCSPVIQTIHSLDFTADFKKIIVSGGGQIALLNPIRGESGEVIADFHTGPITGLAQYTDDYVVSCGTDGTIRVWYLEMNTMMFKLETNVEFSCITINSKVNLAFCGTNDGSMHIFSIDQGSLQFTLVTSFKQHSGPIADIILNPNGTQIVCGGADKEISFFEWEEGTESVYSIGNLTMKSCITSIAYQKERSMYLVALDQGDLCQCLFPSSDEECKWDIIVKCMWTLDFASFGIQVKPDDNDVLISIAQDRRVRMYHLTPPAGDDAYERQLMSEVALAGYHEKNGRAMIVSNNLMPYMFTGAKDGYVAMHDMNHTDHLPEKLLVHDHWRGGISRLLFVEKWMCLVSAGFDGVLFASSFGVDDTMRTVRPLSIGFSAQIELPIDCSMEKGSTKGRGVVHAVASMQEEEEVARLKKELEGIRVSLGRLLQENDDAPALEKLEREEFLIDKSNRSRLTSQTDERLEAIRNQTHLDRLGMMFLADVIKKRCYDTMEQHFVFVRGMKRNVEVTNFPLLKKDPRKEKILQKLRILRLVEREEHIRSGRRCFTSLEQLTKTMLIAKERVDSHPRHMSSLSELYAIFFTCHLCTQLVVIVLCMSVCVC
jgi:WD40 repeat protein